MNKKNVLRRAAPILVIIGLCAWAFGFIFPPEENQVRANLIAYESAPDSSLFRRANGPRPFTFPADYGPHPEFQTEWWYYTGNLQAEDGRRFGYQLTFFRRAIQPPVESASRQSRWATDQVYMAHFTLTDVSGERFRYYERFERGAASLAGAQGEPLFSVWLRDWEVRQLGAEEYRLNAQEGDVALALRMVNQKGETLQGEQGYSRKGPEPGNASYYYSQTRLESEGTIAIGGDSFSVTGLSWLDREISTSALSEGQVGWDWFSLQFDDGSELVAYMIRRADGAIDSFSKGTFIDADGKAFPLSSQDFQIASEATWRSPHSGGVYPARWRLQAPALNLSLDIRPQIADQELNVSFIYWEGSVQVEGTRAGSPIGGFGYVELTGYAQSLEGKF